MENMENFIQLVILLIARQLYVKFVMIISIMIWMIILIRIIIWFILYSRSKAPTPSRSPLISLRLPQFASDVSQLPITSLTQPITLLIIPICNHCTWPRSAWFHFASHQNKSDVSGFSPPSYLTDFKLKPHKLWLMIVKTSIKVI